ncbi:MAG: type II toxin-antitoxin system HicB family antitoxin [Ignavibacteria bacterium]|nr:type II toxin-antitoxin system HicB family antitoxin [Ignavibacteria bacterium]
MNNLKYEIIVYWSDEDKSFIAEMPELPGCLADGETYEEVIKNIKVIAGEWIETAIEIGREIPVPKGKLFYA